MLNPAAWAAVGIALSVVFTLALVPLLSESPRAAALGAQSTRNLPDDVGAGDTYLVLGPYALLGGFAAALLFALAAMIAQLSRR
jgi:hypothetical protein